MTSSEFSVPTSASDVTTVVSSKFKAIFLTSTKSERKSGIYLPVLLIKSLLSDVDVSSSLLTRWLDLLFKPLLHAFLKSPIVFESNSPLPNKKGGVIFACLPRSDISFLLFICCLYVVKLHVK